MKKWCTLVLVTLIGAAQADDSSILGKIEEMQKQIQQQQQMINQLRAKLETNTVTSSQVSTIVRQEVDNAVKDSKGSIINLGKGIDGLTLKGDLRLRYEQRNIDYDNSGGDKRQKSRLRHRVRLGGVWKNKSENWEIGLGLEAGSGGGNSANHSWNEDSTWDSGSVYLDYAYAKHTFCDTGLSLTLGQQKNPFKHSFISFDGDLRPTGAVLQYEQDMFFLTAGAFNIRGDNSAGGGDQSLANMYAAQIGGKFEADNISGLLALGYFHYDDETTEYYDSTGDARDNYAWQIGTVYGEAKIKADAFSTKLFGEVAMNFGADSDFTQASNPGSGYDSEDESLAWVLGTELKFDKFKLSYAYAYIGGDAVPFFTADSDFGSCFDGPEGTNVQGHKLGLSYSVTKNFSVGATAFFTQQINAPDSGSEGEDADGQLYQFDLKYKF